jgi:hypothetical protein
MQSVNLCLFHHNEEISRRGTVGLIDCYLVLLMEDKMFIYSGNCRLCKTGLPSNLIDDAGIELKTGDIVIIYTIAKNTGVVGLHGLSVVVANHYDNFQGLQPVECIEENKSDVFVMGVKTCDIQEPEDNYPKEVWRVRRVKLWSDVIDGEKWVDFGFNYSER